MRAIAASLVVLHHALNVPALAAYYVRPFGTFGVDLFFVISGFIMWATTAEKKRGPLRFWRSRIMRIVPLYWICTTLFIAVAVMFPSAVFTAALDPVHIVKSYLFIPAEHPKLGNISPVYTLGWTLNYEMFFYFLFGLCLLIPHRLARLLVLVGSLALLVAVGRLTEVQGPIARTYTNPILLEFAAGATLAWLAPRLHDARPVLGWMLLSGAVVWLVLIYSKNAAPNLIGAHAFPAIAMVAGALVLEPIARCRANMTGLFLGDASYSIYLAHPFGLRIWYLVLDRTVGVTSFTLGAIFAVTAIAVGLASGAVSYLLLERPIMEGARRTAPSPIRKQPSVSLPRYKLRVPWPGVAIWIAALTLAVGSILLMMPAFRRFALAVPNARSSHQEVTPQGGGFGVVGATVSVTARRF